MTDDEELIARLRSNIFGTGTTMLAADRIEALIKERDDFADQISELLPSVNREAVEQRQRADAAEAKLAENEVRLRKAVEALELIVVDSTWGLEHQTYMKCRKALAAIKGETK